MHDMKADIKTIDGIVVKRQRLSPHTPQNICMDKGYDFPEIEREVIERGYNPHIHHKGEPKSVKKEHPSRRWVVERTGSWHNRFRKLLICWEKKAKNYLGLLQLACCLIIYRRIFLG